MGFSLDISVPALTVFFQGLFSFFSPCVLPLIPLYIGYLSGGTGTKGADGRIHYKRSKVMIHTLFFVIGVSFAFFLLGFGVSALGKFFSRNQMMFARVGGILIVLFGLYQLDVFGKSGTLGKDHRLPLHLDTLVMSPLTALIMGFTFSFAWTPCVGPALASVLLMSATAATRSTGFLLIGIYTLGFVLPFLAVGFFTTALLEFFKKHGQIVKYTVKLGGVLMIVMGLLLFTGKMNTVTGYLSEFSVQDNRGEPSAQQSDPSPAQSPSVPSGNNSTEKAEPQSTAVSEQDSAVESGQSTSESGQPTTASGQSTTASEQPSDTPELLPAIDFTLTDQYGNTHTLSDYKGKTVFLNFWATWCPPCRAEMPDIQKLYETYPQDGDDAVIILGLAAPNYGREKSEDEVKKFLEDHGYTYPVLMDTTGEVMENYGIYSYPTTFMIDRDGNVFGYASGQLTEDIMKSIIDQTLEGKRK